MRIVPYERQYRDDLIFMILEAKNALGRVPTINDDLIDIDSDYLARGDMFWLMLDENDRVVGSAGCHLNPDGEAELHRLYIKYSLKRKGLGSELLRTAETFAKEHGSKGLSVHLGDKRVYAESWEFYPKRGYTEVAPYRLRKEL